MKAKKKRRGKVTMTLPQWILLGASYLVMVWILAQPDEVIDRWKEKLRMQSRKEQPATQTE